MISILSNVDFWHFDTFFLAISRQWMLDAGKADIWKQLRSYLQFLLQLPSTCLYLLEKAVVFVFVLYWYLYLHLCLYFSHLGMKWRERAPIIPIDVRHKLQKRFTVSFPLAFSISPNTTPSQPLRKKDFWKYKYKYKYKSVLQFPSRSRFQFLQTLQPANLEERKIFGNLISNL